MNLGPDGSSVWRIGMSCLTNYQILQRCSNRQGSIKLRVTELGWVTHTQSTQMAWKREQFTLISVTCSVPSERRKELKPDSILQWLKQGSDVRYGSHQVNPSSHLLFVMFRVIYYVLHLLSIDLQH